MNIEDVTYSLKSLMWREMGIERTADRMQDALSKIDLWSRAVGELAPPGPKTWQLENMLLVSRLATIGALAREESRGVHHRTDHPETRSDWRAHTRMSPQFEHGRIEDILVERDPLTSDVAEATPSA